MYKQTNEPTKMYRQTDRQTDKQIVKQTDRSIELLRN